MAFYIGRREFTRLLGGAATAWPLAVRAQRPERTKRIGWLDGTGGADPEMLARLEAFRRELEALGWVEAAQWRLLLVLMPLTLLEAALMSRN